MARLLVLALVTLCALAGPALADEGFAGRWKLTGRYSSGRRTSVELTAERGANGAWTVVRTATLGPDRCLAPTVTWRSSRVRPRGQQVDVVYEAPTTVPAQRNGLIDVLTGGGGEARDASLNTFRARYVVTGDTLREVVTNETRHAPEAFWTRLWTSGRRQLPVARLRVMTFNIHHGEGEDGRLDLARIARTIQAERPDLVALQEVDRGTDRVDGADQPAALGRLTGLAPFYGPNLMRFQGGQYGNAILTRLAGDWSTNHWLPKERDREQRGILDVTITVEFGPRVRETIRFLSTHLEVGSESNRLAQVSSVGDLLADEEPDRPMLLAGDLNAEHDSATMRALRAQGWGIAGSPGEHPTHPAPRPRRQIDHVLYRPTWRWRHVETRVTGNGNDSDHRPLITALELLPRSR